MVTSRITAPTASRQLVTVRSDCPRALVKRGIRRDNKLDGVFQQVIALHAGDFGGDLVLHRIADAGGAGVDSAFTLNDLLIDGRRVDLGGDSSGRLRRGQRTGCCDLVRSCGIVRSHTAGDSRSASGSE